MARIRLMVNFQAIWNFHCNMKNFFFFKFVRKSCIYILITCIPRLSYREADARRDDHSFRLSRSIDSVKRRHKICYQNNVKVNVSIQYYIIDIIRVLSLVLYRYYNIYKTDYYYLILFIVISYINNNKY